MARASAWILLFLICINASAGLFIQSGVAEDWGVTPAPGGDAIRGEFQTTAEDLSGNAGQASFLIGLVVSFANTFLGLAKFVWAGPSLFMNLQVPAWIVTAVFAPMYAIVVFDTIYIFTGRDL